jgi:uncharacterized protein (DUF608 family)
MDRRKFILSTVAGLAKETDLYPKLYGAGITEFPPIGLVGSKDASEELFPFRTLGAMEWSQFNAAGFSSPVCGVIHRKSFQAECGVPLGTIDTGCIDLDTDGTFGYCSMFGSFAPPRGPLSQPFLGLSLGKETWVMALATPRTQQLERVNKATEIHYWGHYPVADLEYESTSPVSVGLRAWTPFIPGDVAISNTPGAVFEVRLRNMTRSQQQGSLTFSFPGPSQAEAQITSTSPRQEIRYNYSVAESAIAQGAIKAARVPLHGDLNGVSVSSSTGVGYVLAVLGEEKVRTGAHLGSNGIIWSVPPDSPFRQPAENDFGTSLTIDLDLGPREAKTVRFILAWYAPLWKGAGDHCFTHMYATRYASPLAVAQLLAREHGSLLSRILSWQQAIYSEEKFPVWLRESLVNNLYMITEDGLWAAAKPPIATWCRPEDGLFGLSESPRECPQMECIPCSFYGNIPLVYFFPELALSTLRGYKAYQYADGAAPWIFGGITNDPPLEGTEMATPTRGYQTTSNGICYADMVDKYWLRTGDDEFLKEFYPSVKKNMIYTAELNPGPDGIISMPAGNIDPANKQHATEWVEGEGWDGMTSHVGGLHLAQLRIVQRMAERMNDRSFAEQCRTWLEQGSRSLENKLWAGKYYLAYEDPQTGKRSDCVFSCQLDGDWIVLFHGLPQVFQQDRARTALSTIKEKNARLSPYGTVFFANPDGTPWEAAGYGAYTYFVSEQLMLAMTYIYAGEVDFGIEQARRCIHNLLQKGYTWNQPCIVQAATGERISGYDYYQNMMLWSLPAAIGDTHLGVPCASGGLVDRVIAAGKNKVENHPPPGGAVHHPEP